MRLASAARAAAAVALSAAAAALSAAAALGCGFERFWFVCFALPIRWYGFCQIFHHGLQVVVVDFVPRLRDSVSQIK